MIKLEKKISDTKITELGNAEYYNYMLIVENWKNNAQIEKLQEVLACTLFAYDITKNNDLN